MERHWWNWDTCMKMVVFLDADCHHQPRQQVRGNFPGMMFCMTGNSRTKYDWYDWPRIGCSGENTVFASSFAMCSGESF
jgi:hypothetical protein